jgi:hypothetical protein
MKVKPDPSKIMETLYGERTPAQRAFSGSNAKVSEELDGVTTITGSKASGGYGDLNLYDAESQYMFRNLSTDFSKNIPTFAGGGIFDSIKSLFSQKPKGLKMPPLKRIMHGTAAGAPESIRATGFREQAGMLGKGVYGSVKGWVADTYRGAGNWKGILPGQGPRLDMLVPQGARTLRGATVVSARQANRALSIADGILSGKYTGATAQKLLPLLTQSTPTMGQAAGNLLRGVGGLLGKASKVPVLTDMLFPEGTSAYDQISGPNAYYNAPGYKAQALEGAQDNMMSNSDNQKPEIVPLPPSYIQIPGKPKGKEQVGHDVPGLDMRTNIFSRSSTYID